MTIIQPFGRACSRQLITRARPSSGHVVSRVAWSFKDPPNTYLLAKNLFKPSYLNISSRLYASGIPPASRPKAHTGRAKAAKPRTTKAAASTRAKTTKKATTKATKKAPARKKTKAKAKAKPKRRSKAKPKPKRRVPTDKQKEIAARKAARSKLTKLKEDALLKEEKAASAGRNNRSAWQFVVQSFKGPGIGGVEMTRQAAAKYKNLSPQEREVRCSITPVLI